jgi:endonuclease/exonuclease/phosphatase family metal-dependent hydrolase
VSSPPALRLMTYNIRHGRGADHKVDLGRIAAVIASYSPDVVALQEVDVGRARSGGEHQAEALARRLGLTQVQFAACVDHGPGGRYGIATLSRLPIAAARQLLLPCGPASEPRSALLTRLSWETGFVDLVNTHLSLRGAERVAQVRALTAAFADRDLVVAGDLNCTPYGGLYRQLLAELPNAARRVRTWPARLPIVQLDHVLYRGGLAVTEALAVTSGPARRASDHLPIAASFVRREDGEVAAITEVTDPEAPAR